jgi:hypothetical protein
MNARVLRALLALAGVLFGLYGYHLLRHDLHSSVQNAVASVVVAWTFLFAGIVAWARRPESRVGVLMTFVAFCLLERKLQYSHNSATFSFGFLFGELGLTAAFAHAVLSYRSGRLRTAFERRFIAASYVVVIGFSLALLMVWDHRSSCIWNDTYCSKPQQPKSLFAVDPDPGLFDAIHGTYNIGVYGALAVVFIGPILRRIANATQAGRRLLTPLLLAAAFASTRAVSEAILSFVPHSQATSDGFYWWQITGQIAVPLALLAGLLTAQLARSTVADLVVELSHIAPGEVRDALARTLNDDSLQVAYWLPMRRVYVDETGRTARPARGRPRGHPARRHRRDRARPRAGRRPGRGGGRRRAACAAQRPVAGRRSRAARQGAGVAEPDRHRRRRATSQDRARPAR